MGWTHTCTCMCAHTHTHTHTSIPIHVHTHKHTHVHGILSLLNVSMTSLLSCFAHLHTSFKWKVVGVSYSYSPCHACLEKSLSSLPGTFTCCLILLKLYRAVSKKWEVWKQNWETEVLVGECPQKAEEGKDPVQTLGLCGQARDHRGALETQSRVRTKQKSGSGSSGPPEWLSAEPNPRAPGIPSKMQSQNWASTLILTQRASSCFALKGKQPGNFFSSSFWLFFIPLKNELPWQFISRPTPVFNHAFPTPAQWSEINCCPTRHRPITLPSYCTAHHCLKL